MSSKIDHDASLDTLLDLDANVLVVDPKGGHWVKFEVRRVPATRERPHGLRYSLTLHDGDGERLVGFDNAHAVRRKAGPSGSGAVSPHDHKHRFKSVRPYDYQDAATLLTDFWAEVDDVLKETGQRVQVNGELVPPGFPRDTSGPRRPFCGGA